MKTRTNVRTIARKWWAEDIALEDLVDTKDDIVVTLVSRNKKIPMCNRIEHAIMERENKFAIQQVLKGNYGSNY